MRSRIAKAGAGWRGWLILALFLPMVFAARSFAQVVAADEGRPGERPAAEERVRAAARALQNGWWMTTPAGGTWAGINAWQRFVIVDSLVRYTRLTGDRSYLPQMEAAVANHEGLDGNDDDFWAVIASLHVYRLTRSPALLEFSRSKFGQLTDQYWDQTCGGGMWWDHQRTYKNAITNELLLYAAGSLYLTTKDPVYSAWAVKEWDWFRRSGMINAAHLVNDGLTASCKNNGSPTYTYNQGVLLGGLLELHAIEGNAASLDEAFLLAQAAVSKLSVAGILQEPTTALNQDGQTFKGVFVAYVGELVPFADDSKVRKALRRFLRRNADSLWRHRERPGDKLNAFWDGRGVVYGAAAQAAGLDLLDAALQAGSPKASLEAR